MQKHCSYREHRLRCRASSYRAWTAGTSRLGRRIDWSFRWRCGRRKGRLRMRRSRRESASSSSWLRQLRILRLCRVKWQLAGRAQFGGWAQHRRDFFSSATRQVPVCANHFHGGQLSSHHHHTIKLLKLDTDSNLAHHPSVAMAWYLIALGISNMTPVHAKISPTVHDTLCIDKLNKRNCVAHRSRVLTKGNVVQCLFGFLLASSLRALRQRDILLRTKTESSRPCALHLLQAKLF